MKSVGIDIGSYKIKVAEVDTSGKSYSLTQYYEFQLNPEPQEDKKIPILEALQRVASQYDPESTKFTIGLSNEHILSRHKVFPFQERYKILRSIPFEMEDEIPFDTADVIFDTKILRLRPKSAEVIAVACPKERVGETLQIALDAGIDPDTLSVDAFALANCFEDWSHPPRVKDKTLEDEESFERSETAQVLIHFGHVKTHILVFFEGTLMTARTVYFGGYNLADQLRKKYNIPINEAMKALQEKGFILTSQENTTPDQRAFSEALTQPLNTFCNDVRLQLLELQSEYKITVDRIGISGAVSQLLNLTPFLTSRLELPVNVSNPTKALPDQKIGLSAESEKSIGVALGLAIEGLKRPRNPALNFRKQEHQKQSQSLTLMWTKWKHAVAVAAVAYFCFFAYSFLREGFATGIAGSATDAISKQAKTFELKGSAASLANLKKFVNEKKREINDRKTLSQLQTLNSPLDVLADLSSKLPGGDRLSIDVKRLLVMEDTMTLEGDASTNQTVTQMKQYLETVAKDRSVQTNTPSISASSGKIPFAFTFKVSRHFGGNP
jgi:general secretion pathway protein L